MSLNIKDPETDHLARRLARITGESLTEAINKALRTRLAQETRRRGKSIDRAEIDAIVKRIAARPVLDERAPEVILGYDEHGLPD